MATLLDDFGTAIDKVADKVTGVNSIYDKTLTKLDTLYTDMGMSQVAKNEAIANVSAQLATSTTNAAISAAVEIAKATGLVEAQVLTEVERKNLLVRQTEGFNDKLKTEVSKGMAGIGQMEATTGTTQAATLLSINKTFYIAYKAAGIADADNPFKV